MTMPAILRLVGAKVGPVKGSARRASDSDLSREGKIVVVAYEHTVLAERADATEPLARPGAPGDKRTHGHLVITKPLCRATPILHKAQSLGDVFTDFALQCYRVPPAGGGRGASFVREEGHWLLILQGARIASIRTWMRNPRAPAFAGMPECEEIAFTYDTIGFGWAALTGNPMSPNETFKLESAALPGDFARADADMVAKRMVDKIGSDLGKSIGKQLGDFLKGEGKQLILDHLKQN